jgi:hypothetical protein
LAICARTGSPDVPVDVGWLVHQVRPVAGGAEMRCRFFIGGRHIGLRSGKPLADKIIKPVAARLLPDPRHLLVHCAQEMNHLAGFLPGVVRAMWRRVPREIIDARGHFGATFSPAGLGDKGVAP